MKNPTGVKAFGVHLRHLREERGWSQEELADYANVAKMTVHRIETAQFSATLDVLISLARALDKPVNELLRAPGVDQYDEETRPT